jgi:HSP20 family molecular chaperone IbpA
MPVMSHPIAIEVHHGRHAMAVVARLPGVRFEDVRIVLEPNELTIDADGPDGVRHYALALASPVDDRRVTMRFRDGVLWMHLPKLPT